MTNQLTVGESTELAALEIKIAAGLQTFVEVGAALMEIRDKRLYRAEFGTFEEYCQERWGMKRAHAYRLIESAGVIANLSPIGDIPKTESQARPLTRLEPQQQRDAWQQAVETAPAGKVTAAHVEAVVAQMTTAAMPELVTTSKPHVSNNSGNNEWYTPTEYIDAARFVMGGIDCDPASSIVANRTVGASTFYTEENDGLAWDWHGRVWMNPPYAQPLISQFCEKLVDEVQLGMVVQACVLVNNATDTRWGQLLIDNAAAVCFVRRRIRFLDMDGNPSGAPLQGQMVAYFGQNVSRFTDAFAAFGVVLCAAK